jgi:hypothetical protein
MKWAFGILVFIWLLCGLIGTAMLGELDSGHWKAIGRGPITLSKAFRDDPPSYPGPS